MIKRPHLKVSSSSVTTNAMMNSVFSCYMFTNEASGFLDSLEAAMKSDIAEQAVFEPHFFWLPTDDRRTMFGCL